MVDAISNKINNNNKASAAGKYCIRMIDRFDDTAL